mgnify:FL=1
MKSPKQYWQSFVTRMKDPDDPFMRWGMRIYERFTSGNVLGFLHRFHVPGVKTVSWDNVLRLFLREIFSGDTTQRAKSLSFSFMMSFPPMLVFLMTLIAYFPVDGLQNEFLNNLATIIPPKVAEPVKATINDIMGHRRSGLQVVAFLSSLILAANGLFSLFRTFRNPKVEAATRPWIVRYFMSFALVLVLYILIIMVLFLMMEYHRFLGVLTDRGVIRWSESVRRFVGVARWVVLFLFTMMATNMIYYTIDFYWMKNKSSRMRFFSIGAVMTTIMFFIYTSLFELYIDNFNNYNILYGSIGTLLVLFLWIYFSCQMLLVGYELNRTIMVEAEKQQREKTIEKRDRFV